MIFIEIILVIGAILLLVPVMVLMLQVLVAALVKRKPLVLTKSRPLVAVIIPAHNEEALIETTLLSILPQLDAGDRLIVIADNCSDDTALIARDVGVEVIERTNQVERGKGYALDFGLSHCRLNPPEVVIIIDADCRIAPGTISELAITSVEFNRPVQALYLMLAPDGAGIKTKIAEFAWVVKNLVRPLGFLKLGLPCQLMGTGMAFPWSMISNVNLANGNIVEDMKLGVDLAMAGTPPLLYFNSMVTSYFPVLSEVQSGQRTRWEHGHLAMILSEAPKLFAQGISKGDKNLLAMAFDLSIPPLALLVALQLGYAVITGITFNMFHVGDVAFFITLLGTTLLISAISIAWMGWGRNIISFSKMLLVPVYVISKIPHYVKFLFKRQKAWNKTERDKV
jgi:glycosyltransferase involved in cell wall biosynthesis